MGGEKLGRMAVAISVIGSPPHGRGKVLCSVFGVLPHRITPAWAGKSSSTRTRLPIRWDHPRMGGEKPPHWWRSSITEDHPRMGGEKPLSNVVCSTFSGSPPHGRGKVSFCHAAGFGLWITPAWAGKSGHCHRGTGGSWDHPRIGGEKDDYDSSGKELQGSPPHGRGKGTSMCVKFVYLRITPAWAGKSA